MNTEFVLALKSIVLGWILIYRNWSVFHFRRAAGREAADHTSPKLQSGTSKPNQLVPVHLNLPLLWKSHCALSGPSQHVGICTMWGNWPIQLKRFAAIRDQCKKIGKRHTDRIRKPASIFDKNWKPHGRRNRKSTNRNKNRNRKSATLFCTKSRKRF